jgi:hypothetical protein
VSDIWSIYYNPAGISKFNDRKVSFSYIPSQFGLKELSKKALVYFEPSLPVKIGLGVKIFGFDLYKETVLTIAVARNFNSVSFGLALNYYLISIRKYGSTGVPSLDLGLVVEPISQIRTGFVFKNIFSGTIGKTGDKLPRMLEVGIAYMPFQNLCVSISTAKELNFKESVKYGVEYKPADIIALRFGLSNYPASYSFGAGLNHSLLQIDYSISRHNELGFTHQISLSIKLGR